MKQMSKGEFVMDYCIACHILGLSKEKAFNIAINHWDYCIEKGKNVYGVCLINNALYLNTL